MILNRALRSAVCILMFSILAGCATYETKKILPSPGEIPLSREFNSTLGAIEVRGYSLADKEASQTYLGIDPAATGMVPLFIKIQNNDANPIKVDVAKCFLTSSGGENFRSLTFGECCDRARRGDVGPVLGAAIAFGATGAVISGSQVAGVNRSLEQDYYDKQFRPTLINSGGLGEGVLFFDVPKDKQAAIRVLILTAIDVSTNDAKEIRVELSL